MTFPTGWIKPADRTQEQRDAHDAALALMPRFALGASDIPTGPLDIQLDKGWSHPDVVSDTGITFDRFHQITGSCVGAGGGNALYTLICVQRLVTAGATRAFVPWWPHPYGLSRSLAGMRGEGDGSFGSTFFRALREVGVPDAAEATAQGIKGFRDDDGFMLTREQELDWSDGNSALVKGFTDEAMRRPLGSGSEVSDVVQARAAIANGSPLTFACDRYVGNGRVVTGAGGQKYVVGKWDTYGGHQQYVTGVKDDADLGPMFKVGNNWPKSVYPTLPDQTVNSTWVLEKDFKAAMGYDSEVYALSHLAGGVVIQPSIPELFSWYI